jgi:hypothetical protein
LARLAAVRKLVAALVIALALPAAAQAAPFRVSVYTPTWKPGAGARWEYGVIVTDNQGEPVAATVYPLVIVGGRKFDSLGSHYTMVGIVGEQYEWSRRLRLRRDVVFRLTVYALGTKVVRRFPVLVR